MKLVECVPNISEGRDDAVIEEIAQAAAAGGAQVLDVDKGRSTNRTVITLAGSPEAVDQSAFALISKAAELIDMRHHQGEHPRIGATDVCPFIPLEDVSMAECAELAKRLGKRVGDELDIPVYLYGEAASTPPRKSLSFIRQGEYEGIPAKLNDPSMQPDFGPAVFNEKSGVTVIGARPFLIAYNINLNTTDKKLAQEIAVKIRESGGKKKAPDGSLVRDAHGQPVIEPGIFTNCAAVGWYLDEFGIAQVSINLTNFEITPIHAVFDTVCRLAEERGLRVTGSEIVGLVPKKALLQAGRHYLKKQGCSPGLPQNEVYFCAVKSLGLSELRPFVVKEKVIEEKIKVEGLLAKTPVDNFVDLLASRAPTPGGGSASALAGSLAAALAAMVSTLSVSKASTDSEKNAMLGELGIKANNIRERLVTAVDQDTQAFDKVSAARRIKAATPEEKSIKERAVIDAYKEATSVPLDVMRDCLEALELAKEVLIVGTLNAFSDSAVSAQLAYAGLLGASYNVKINIKDLNNKGEALSNTDQEFLDKTGAEMQNLLTRAQNLLTEVNQEISKVF